MSARSRPTDPMTPRSRRARYGLLGAGMAGLAFAACGGEAGETDEGAEAAGALVAVAPPGEGPDTAVFDFAALRDRIGPAPPPAGTTAGFAHDPHAGVECAGCHADPPGHASHGTVECADCHRSELPADVPAAIECRACHHAPERADPCTRCHDGPGELPGALVPQPIRVAGAPEARVRGLAYRHDVHAAVECVACHTTAGGFDVAGGCVACHEEHHRPASDCRACHAPLPLETHPAEVHGGCAGAGCHTDPVVTALPATRGVCLVCHGAQVDHRPGQECAYCHAPPTGGSGP